MSITLNLDEQRHLDDVLSRCNESNEMFLRLIHPMLLRKITNIKFPSEWSVEPVFDNRRAVIRFIVNDRFSIFFDAVGELLLGKMLWEYYDMETEELGRFDIGEVDEMIEEIQSLIDE